MSEHPHCWHEREHYHREGRSVWWECCRRDLGCEEVTHRRPAQADSPFLAARGVVQDSADKPPSEDVIRQVRSAEREDTA